MTRGKEYRHRNAWKCIETYINALKLSIQIIRRRAFCHKLSENRLFLITSFNKMCVKLISSAFLCVVAHCYQSDPYPIKLSLCFCYLMHVINERFENRILCNNCERKWYWIFSVGHWCLKQYSKKALSSCFRVKK